MSFYKDYKLVKEDDGYSVVIFLNPDAPEFSTEFLENVKENILSLDDDIREYVINNFSDLKINSIKLVLGAVVVGSLRFIGHTKAQAAELTPSTAAKLASSSTFNAAGEVTVSSLNVRQGPSTNFTIITKLYVGNKIKILGESSGWYKIQLSNGKIGWVNKSYIKADISKQKIDFLISTARSLLGTPYVWGGSSPQDGGFDCSGFTKYSYSKVGYTLNRISRDQATQGIAVSASNLKPGDLLFYSLSGNGAISHVGIYIGNGQMIHSPKSGDTVKVTNITTSFWKSRFVTARRIIQ